MAYHQDVKFLSEVVPALVERNADEFRRAHDLLGSVEPAVRRARDDTDWEGAGRDKYDARLADVNGLITGLGAGFDRARAALYAYAAELEKARLLVEEGQVTERKLAAEIGKVADAVTRTAQKAEPMRQWEDIRSTTGFLDWIAELGMDVDSIREDAERFYEQTGSKFEQGKVAEENARRKCLDELKVAYDKLPDFRADSKDAATITAGVREITDEARQATGGRNVALPGSGPKTDLSSFDPNAAESATLKRFRELANTLPAGTNTPYWSSEGSAEFRAQWIKDNRQAIVAAAEEAGLPPDLVAGIAWQEVGGKGRVWDDVTQFFRDAADSDWSPVTPENLPDRAGGAPDEVSYGPLSIQVRRAAEVLGYDPENLSDEQRDEVIAASKEPRTNILISAQHLADLKAQSGFADVPAGQMTPEHYAELGARYNGGPSWDTNPDAQAYGRTLNENLPDAKKAMQ
jgi:soluble lytic murein transglycosylase-like protein